MCKLCGVAQDKEKIVNITVKKSFVLLEIFIDVFHYKNNSRNQNCHFILLMSGFLVKYNMED